MIYSVHKVPYGYYVGYSYIGYLPDGTTMEFTNEAEYMEYISDFLANSAKEEPVDN